MAYSLGFEYDAFISYAVLDNEGGWVSSFRERLNLRSAQLAGRDLVFWMNTEITGSDLWHDAISPVIQKAAVFIPIITPAYLHSEYCLRELQAFIGAADKTGGLVIGNRSRIFKVIKIQVPLEEHPKELQNLLGYEFYRLEPADGRPVEFTYQGATEKDYLFKLDDLAHDIIQMLEVLKDLKPSGEETTLTDEPKRKKPYRPTETTEKVSTEAGKITETAEVDLATRPVSVHLHSDLWTLDDRLGYSLYAKAIAEFIHHRNTNPPLTIGIYAPWGQGKTTLMRLIEIKLRELSQGQKRAGPSHESDSKNGEPTPEAPRTTFRELKDWLNNAKTPKPAKLSYPTVWFNAWKYQNSEQVWAGLAHCIISDLVAQIPKALDREKFWLALQAERLDFNKIRTDIQNSLVKQILPKVFNLGILALVCSFIILGVLIGKLTSWIYGGSLSTLGPLFVGVGKWIYEQRKVLNKPLEGEFTKYVSKPDYEGKMGFFSQVEQDIRRVFALLIDPKQPAAVFVDDLDRCSPGKVAEVMEAINLFLSGDFPNAYFIIGIDAQAVAASMEVAHERLTEKLQATTRRYGSLGWYFMEKMVQLPFVIPVITDEQRDGYLKELFKKNGSGNEDTQQDKLSLEKRIQDLLQNEPADRLIGKIAKEADLLNKLDAQKRREFQEQAIQKGAQAFADDSDEIHMYLNRYLPYLANKPRTIKRFVNLYRFYRMSQWARQLQNLKTANPAALGRWIVIMLRWPQMVRWIQWEGELGLFVADSPYRKAEKIEKMADDSKDFEDWRETLAKNGITDIGWLTEQSVYEFLRKRLSDNERLTEALEVGVW